MTVDTLTSQWGYFVCVFERDNVSQMYKCFFVENVLTCLPQFLVMIQLPKLFKEFATQIGLIFGHLDYSCTFCMYFDISQGKVCGGGGG
jgi:hypothetical protein